MRIPLLSFFLLAAGAADGTLNVVATTSNMGMLARAVGGDGVKVTFAPPDRDPHFLQAKPTRWWPSERRPPVAVGAELEVGCPGVLQGPRTEASAGQPGYRGGCPGPLIERAATLTARGDVHPWGTPPLPRPDRWLPSPGPRRAPGKLDPKLEGLPRERRVFRETAADRVRSGRGGRRTRRPLYRCEPTTSRLLSLILGYGAASNPAHGPAPDLGPAAPDKRRHLLHRLPTGAHLLRSSLEGGPLPEGGERTTPTLR
jgi:hypothetical protein